MLFDYYTVTIYYVQGRFAIFGDLQIPFEARYALHWAKEIVTYYKIPKENVCLAGDEIDEYWASAYGKDPDALHTPTSELRESLDKLKEWYSVFPLMRVPTSNHGMRWFKRANDAGIPSAIIKTYSQILEAPNGWRWADRWLIDAGKTKFLLTHGMEFGGANLLGAALAAEQWPVVFGHHHSKAGVMYQQNISTEEAPRLKRWASCTGSLINTKSYAFKYGKFNKLQPVNGCTVVLDEGLTAIWVPYPYAE